MTEFKPEELEETTKYITEDEVRAIISTSLTNFSQTTRVQAGYLQSGNFKTGVSGWKITSGGNVEFGSGYFRGDITGATGTFSGTLVAGISITTPTITGGIFQTAVTGARTVISGNDISLYDDTTGGSNPVTGNSASILFPRTDNNWGTSGTNYFIIRKRTSTADDFDNVLEVFPNTTASSTGSNYIFLGRDGANTAATYIKTLTFAASTNISFEDTTTSKYLDLVASQIVAYKDIVPISSAIILGGSSFRWNNVYAYAANIDGNITVTGTVDGVDIYGHNHSGSGYGGQITHSWLASIGASDHHSSVSNALAITPSTIVASSTISGTTFNTTTGVIYYGANAVFDMYDGYVNVVNQHLYPSGDNSKTCGKYNQRWSDIRTVLINGADYGFENNWYLTENYRVGIKEDGIAVLNSNNELVMFMGKTGLYVKSGNVKNVDELPYIKTTIEQRAKMDINPEIRIHETDTEILEIPISTDAKIGGANYKEKKIIIKANKKVE